MHLKFHFGINAYAGSKFQCKILSCSALSVHRILKDTKVDTSISDILTGLAKTHIKMPWLQLDTNLSILNLNVIWSVMHLSTSISAVAHYQEWCFFLLRYRSPPRSTTKYRITACFSMNSSPIPDFLSGRHNSGPYNCLPARNRRPPDACLLNKTASLSISLTKRKTHHRSIAAPNIYTLCAIPHQSACSAVHTGAWPHKRELYGKYS